MTWDRQIGFPVESLASTCTPWACPPGFCRRLSPTWTHLLASTADNRWAWGTCPKSAGLTASHTGGKCASLGVCVVFKAARQQRIEQRLSSLHQWFVLWFTWKLVTGDVKGSGTSSDSRAHCTQHRCVTSASLRPGAHSPVCAPGSGGNPPPPSLWWWP